MSLLLLLNNGSSSTAYVISANTGASFGGVVDTKFRELNSTSNYSSDTTFSVNTWTTGDRETAVLRFGGITSVPAGTAANAKLQLQCTDDFGGAPVVDVYALRRSFVDTQATWEEASTGNAWATEGALNSTTDYEPTLLGTANAAIGLVELTSAALTAYTDDVINGVQTHYGFLLVETNFAAPASIFEVAVFVSSEGTDGQRPRWTFDWTASGGSAQSLTVGLVTNTQSFFAANVTAGAATVSPVLYNDADSFFSATVLAGGMPVNPSLVTNSNSFFGVVITLPAYNLLPALYTNAQVFYGATVTAGSRTLSPPLLGSTEVIYTGVVSTGGTIFPSLYTDGDSFFSPTVAIEVTVEPPLVGSSNVLYTPTVVAGAMNVVAPLLSSATTLFAPTVAGSQAVLPPLLGSTEAVFAHNLSLAPYVLSPAVVSNSNSFLAATVTGRYNITNAVFTNTQSFFGAVITTGAATIVPQIVANQQQFYFPTVTGGTVVDEGGGVYSLIDRRRRLNTRRQNHGSR